MLAEPWVEVRQQRFDQAVADLTRCAFQFEPIRKKLARTNYTHGVSPEDYLSAREEYKCARSELLEGLKLTRMGWRFHAHGYAEDPWPELDAKFLEPVHLDAA